MYQRLTTQYDQTVTLLFDLFKSFDLIKSSIKLGKKPILFHACAT